MFRLPLVILLCGARSCSRLRSRSRALCVCAATRPAVCATFNGAESRARRRRGRLLTAEFAFARFVLYTENCHKYTRSTHQRRAHTRMHKRMHVCMHSHSHDCDYSYLFIICFLLQKIRKKNNNVFLYCNLASINSPDTWPFWADPSRRRSTAQSRCDRQASRLFRFQFQLDHRRRLHHPITSLTMRKLHSDRVIVF